MIVEARVKTNQPEFSITGKGAAYEISVKGRPEGNEANLEIIRELGKLTGKEVRILRGLKSKRKLIEADMAALEVAE